MNAKASCSSVCSSLLRYHSLLLNWKTNPKSCVEFSPRDIQLPRGFTEVGHLLIGRPASAYCTNLIASERFRKALSLGPSYIFIIEIKSVCLSLMLFKTISYEKKCTGSWIHISRNFFPSTRTSSSHLQSLSGILSISVVLAKSPLHWEIVTHFTGEQTHWCTNFEYWASDMTRYKSTTKVKMKCVMSEASII